MFTRIIAVILLIIFIPIFCVISILLLFEGKVFFCQKRVGLHEKLFTLYKFKTMNDKKDKNGNLLPDQKRVTKVGKLLRKTSLDELPQLWNIILGQMNFVGPRPLLVEYLPLYSEFQKKRHLVKPGITGLAQVKGRNDTTWKRRLAIDVWYVKHQSFTLDMKIIYMTFKNIITRADGAKPMPKFKGN